MVARVWRYGLLSPTSGLEVFEEQARLAHRYYNQLVEAARALGERRKEITALDPEIQGLDQELVTVNNELRDRRDAIKRTRQRTRSRSESKQDREKIRDLQAKAKELRGRRKAIQKRNFDQGLHHDQYRQNYAQFDDEMKQLTRGFGLHWTTYNEVRKSIGKAMEAVQKNPTRLDGKASIIRFKRWDGSGSVGGQVNPPVTWQGIVEHESASIQVDIEPTRCGHGKPRPRVRVRVKTNKKKPVWVEWPVVLHRPVPDDALITGAVVKRERFGGRDRWALFLTLRLPDGWAIEKPESSGAVAVDLAWRRMRDTGDLRAGYWRDDQGNKGEILLDPSIRAGLQKTRDLRSIRDKALDLMKQQFTGWIKDNKDAAPQWFQEASQWAHQWRSPARFAALANRWRESRWPGDDQGFCLVEAWRQQDRHLWQWEVNQRDKTMARRREQYRVLGAQLARRYKTLVLEDFDLRKFQQRKAVESEVVDNDQAHAQQVEVSPSTMRASLENAFSTRHGTVVKIPAAYTTIVCHGCGKVEQWDQAMELRHRCEGCGVAWDQDDNACRNLLQAAGYLDGQKVKGVKVKDYSKTKRAESKWRRLRRKKQEAEATG